MEDLRARADVLAASPNHISRIMREPNDPRYVSGELWGLAAIRAPEAWDAATGSTDVYVAVADTGIYAAHEDLQPNLDTGLNRNFARAEGAAVDRSDYMDVHGHGTCFTSRPLEMYPLWYSNARWVLSTPLGNLYCMV